jgi:hypothetical protein
MYPSVARHLRTWAVLVALAFSSAAYALNIRPPSFPELVASADLIVTGRIERVDVELKPVNGQQVPFTQVHIAVAEVIKGAAQGEVVLQCLGGTVGTKSLRVVGAPVFVPGDEGFFFVQHNGTQFVPLVGINHGCYWTTHDAATGQPRVLRENRQPLTSVADVALPIETPPGLQRTVAALRADAALSPDVFKAHIKTELNRHAP